jgi:hypothetical protein
MHESPQMITLTVTGHAEPEQSREEIARELEEHGVGAVCLLRNGGVATLLRRTSDGFIDFGPLFGGYHYRNGEYQTGFRERGGNDADIIRVFPPGTRLRVTVEVGE